MALWNSFNNYGSVNVVLGTLVYRSNDEVIHNGNFNVSSQAVLKFTGIHKFTGKTVGDIIFEEGLFEIKTLSFTSEWSTTVSKPATILLTEVDDMEFVRVTIKSNSTLKVNTSLRIDTIIAMVILFQIFMITFCLGRILYRYL